MIKLCSFTLSFNLAFNRKERIWKRGGVFSPGVCRVPVHDVPLGQSGWNYVEEENSGFPNRQSSRCPLQGAHPDLCRGPHGEAQHRLAVECESRWWHPTKWGARWTSFPSSFTNSWTNSDFYVICYCSCRMMRVGKVIKVAPPKKKEENRLSQAGNVWTSTGKSSWELVHNSHDVFRMRSLHWNIMYY